MTQQSILILGANGMVGQALTTHWGSNATPLTHVDCDVTNPQALAKVMAQYRPAALANCAAITNVDQCEQDQTLARQVNTDAVTTMAQLCKDHSCTLIHFSTDYVFDGSGNQPSVETRSRHPINYYGVSKQLAEEAIEDIAPDYIIARVQWIFGAGRHNFIGDAVQKLQKDEEVKAFSDQWGTPTYANDIAAMVDRLYQEGQRGIFHTVNRGYVTRADIAHEIAHQLDVPAAKITEVATAAVPLPAQRPLNSRLSIDKIQKLGIVPPTWQDAVGRYLCSIIKK